MEIKHAQVTHSWDTYRLAAQILRSWVRDVQDTLPAWTPPGLVAAYAQLLEGCDAILAAIRAAEREARRDA